VNNLQRAMIVKVSLSGLLIFLCQSAFCQFANIKLDEETPTNRVTEPSIAVNPKNTANIVAASILDNIYYTFDGGASWTTTKLKSPLGVYGDPVLVADGKGTFYAFHLSDPTGEGWRNEKSLDHIVCHVSKDGGRTWDEGNSIGYNPPKDQDKPWATVDTKGNVFVAWTEFDKYASPDSTCQSNIVLSISSNGKKWSKPVKLSQTPGNCVDDDDTAEGAVPAVSADGKVFVAWANGGQIYLDRSFDGGGMWLTNDITVGEQPGGWDLSIPGHDRCNGMPVLMVDQSNGYYRGCLYLVWADQRNGPSDTDVWFMRSNTYGDNWSTPLKIGKDSTNRHQYLPWMTVDQKTGYIYIVYYDRSQYDDNQTDVYLAYSSDSGASFKSERISETPFTPVDTSFFGDYTNISAHDGVIVPVWARMDNGVTSVWTAIIRQDDLIPPKDQGKGKKKR
jgi:hypothetical protein